MVEPSPFIWVLGVIGGLLVVISFMIVGMWWVRRRDTRQGRISGHTKTVTHIVNKENNPDLLSMFE